MGTDEEDLLQVRQLIQDGLDPFVEVLVYDQVAAAGIRQPILKLWGGPPAIQTDGDTSDGGSPEQGYQPIGLVIR